MSEFSSLSGADLNKSDLVNGKSDERSALTRFSQAFVESFAYRAVKAPAQALAQLAGADTGTITQEPPSKDSAAYHGQIFGDAAAVLTHLLVAKRFLGAGSSVLGSSAAKLEASCIKTEFIKGAALGSAYEGLLRPSTSEELSTKGLLHSRFENAIIGASIFGTMNATAAGLRNLSLSAEARGYTNLSSVLTNQPLVGAFSGIPAGIVAAETGSLVKQHRLATWNEINNSVYGMGIVGFGFGVLGRYAEGNAPHTEGNGTSFADFFRAKAERAGEVGDRFLNHIFGPRPELAFAGNFGGTDFRPANFNIAPESARNNVFEIRATANDGSGRVTKGALEGRAPEAVKAPQEISHWSDAQRNQFFAEGVLPHIKNAEAMNRVSSTVVLPDTLSKAQESSLTAYMREMGFVADIFREPGASPELFVSWAPSLTKFTQKPSLVIESKIGIPAQPATVEVRPAVGVVSEKAPPVTRGVSPGEIVPNSEAAKPVATDAAAKPVATDAAAKPVATEAPAKPESADSAVKPEAATTGKPGTGNTLAEVLRRQRSPSRPIFRETPVPTKIDLAKLEIEIGKLSVKEQKSLLEGLQQLEKLLDKVERNEGGGSRLVRPVSRSPARSAARSSARPF